MALLITEIKEILKSPRNKGIIPSAVSHELRLGFHSETTTNRNVTNGAVTLFLEWVKTLIPPDKFRIFLTLFRYPVKTVSLTDEIYSALEKVFDGQNPVFNYEFLSDNQLEDWEEYRTQELKEPTVWQTKAFEAMKTSINSVMVVDLPSEQKEAVPSPYFFFLPISSVIDFGLKEDVIDWIIFDQPGDTIAVYDDGFYRVYNVTRKNGLEITTPVLENAHDLGYCPAKFFWTSPMTYKQPAIKKSPITNHLSDLDWFLFYIISKRHSDLYVPWPIYWGIEQDCDYEHPEKGETCDGGFLRTAENDYIVLRDGTLRQCPACIKKRIAGAGTFIDVPAPDDENDMKGIIPPAGVIPTDGGALKHNVDEVARLAKEIYTSVTGSSVEVVSDQAINEKQVLSLFESRKAVLLKIKSNFEQAQTWVDSTICRLRYGPGFVSANINYGTEFYLFSADVLLEMYIMAKDKKADDPTLDLLQDRYYETLFRNDPMKMTRQRILMNLDPFRHVSKNEVREMYGKSEVEYNDYMLKVSFSTLIMKFERENGSLVEFGIALNYNKRIDAIRKALISYIIKPAQPAPAPPIPASA